MKVKNSLLIFFAIVAFLGQVKAQEFRGMDVRMESQPENPTSQFKPVFLDLYFNHPDSVEMDSFLLVCEWYDWVYFQEHQYLDNGNQLLRFMDTIGISSIPGPTCFNLDTLVLGDLVNLSIPDTVDTVFGTYLAHWPYNTDPVFNSLQSEMYIENGVIYYDASGIDPDGQVLGYYLKDNFRLGQLHHNDNYFIPEEAFLDSVTGQFTWRPTEAGKYLFSIGYSQSFGEIAPSWATSTQRYMVFEIKEEDIVATSLLKEEEAKSINIFPNPSTGIVNVEKTRAEKYNLKLFDVNGKILQEQKSIESVNYSLDLREFPRGLYFLHVFDGEKTEVRKIILN